MRDVIQPPLLNARGDDLELELEAREPKVTGKQVWGGIKKAFSFLFGG